MIPSRTKFGRGATGAWRHAPRFATGGGVPTAYYQAGGTAVPPVSERQARLNRIREFERRFGSVRV